MNTEEIADLSRFRVHGDAMIWQQLSAGLVDIFPDPLPTRLQEWSALIEADDLEYRQDALEEGAKNGGCYISEYRMTGRDGKRYWLLEKGIIRADACIESAMVLDITELRQRQSLFGRLAYYDDMTGVYNHFHLREMLEHALASAKRYEESGAYILIAIDSLTKVNEAFGVETGDAIMAEVCMRINKCLRTTDSLGRIDGNRLGVVLSKCNVEDVQHVAARFLRIVNDDPIETQQGPLQASISIGSVIFPAQGTHAVECIQKAETALKQAKAAGRNCHFTYTFDARDASEQKDLAVKGNLIRHALQEHLFKLAFQPIVTADSREAKHYECLLRLDQGRDGIMAAGHFIGAAEELGLIRLIDRHVLELITQELQTYPNLNLAFNISAMTTGDHAWLDTLYSLVHNAPDVAQRLMIEITETKSMDETEATVKFVKKIRDLGCHVALDDFGAGYTSFRQLKALPVNYMKIDGEFTRNFAASRESKLFVRTLLDLARALHMHTIAEGVETEEQYIAMRDEGVDLLQGYYFGKPTIAPEWRL